MKTKISLFKLLIVALLGAALVACTPAAEAASRPAAEPTLLPAAQDGPSVPRTITVVGTGQASLAPDVVEVQVGVQVLAPTVSEAKASVDRQMAALLAALKELGIADKDIQTSQYNIYYEQDQSAVSLREGAAAGSQGGYRVSNMVKVTVRDIDLASDVLDAAVEAGANQVYGVNFTVSDPHKWESEARKSAMADATLRAQELAGLAGVELGEILSVSEVVGSSPVPMFAAVAERGLGGGGIAPGELEFSTQVQVVFAIR
jgi:uncharacterized protein YggE